MIAVMGASGNTGGEIARTLLAEGRRVRVLGRSAERLAEFEATGAEVAVGDATDADYLARAFAGADAVYTLMPYDPANPDYHSQQRELGGAVAEAIGRAGVSKVVALSAIGADVAEGTGAIASLHEQEARLRDMDDVDVLFLRPGMFFETFYGSLEFVASAGFMGDVVAPDKPVPMVASRDVAAVAARRLSARDFSGKEVEEVLGPRDYTFTEVAKTIGERIGHPGLEYVAIPGDELRSILVEAGLSADYAGQVVGLNEAISSGVISATRPQEASRTTTTFEEFSVQLAGAFETV